MRSIIYGQTYVIITFMNSLTARQLTIRNDPETMWPNGVFLPPDDEMQALLDLQHIGNGKKFQMLVKCDVGGSQTVSHFLNYISQF